MEEGVPLSIYQRLNSVEGNFLDQVILPEHFEVIARLPQQPDERFDLCFLHAAYQPIFQAVQSDLSTLFQPSHDYYNNQRFDYLTNFLIKRNEENMDHLIWDPLIGESTRIFADRQLFQDQYYRKAITLDYQQLLKSGFLEKDAMYRVKLRQIRH